MNSAFRIHGNQYILLDERLRDVLHEHVFTPLYWRARDALGDPLGGRGAAWRIRAGELDWVLRFYRRGGLPGKLILDAYFFTGVERSRPWREWRLLAWMVERGLPVPRPVAARVVRNGLVYRGALITETVPGESLASRISQAAIPESGWLAVGRSVRRFHDAGVWHADLNANNILVDGENGVHVIDFDRGRLRPQDTAWREANLARLRRSLQKLFPDQAVVDAGWLALQAGYRGD